MHSFFGCGIDDEMRVGKFDDSKFDVVVFDEINLNDLKFLTRIKQYCDNHPEKIILATGDVFQNDPIDPLSTAFEHKQYSNQITSVIFHNCLARE